MTSDGSVPVSNGRCVYISGPMRGYPEYNFPAFRRAALILRNSGFRVVNPAEINSDQCDQEQPHEFYMRRDIKALVDAEVTDLAVLDGWHKSKGANQEVTVASYVGIPVSVLEELPGDIARLTPLKENVLQEAQRLVYGDRQKDYGHPLDDFTKTAMIWQAILGHKMQKGTVIEPEDIGLCMVGVKISREVNHPKRDNRTDGAGYFATIDMLHEEKERRRGQI